jgi:acetyl-CoA C-acetyltransferase
MYDGLFCAFDQCAMGAGTEKYAASAGLDRASQDEFAALSHERAATGQKDGLFDDEIVPVEVPQRKGDPLVVREDEGVRPGTTVESLAGLRPAFDKAGNITAGNASQISDGAAAVIVADRAAAEAAGLPIVAEIVAYGQVGGADATLHERPAQALQIALHRAGMSVGDLDVVEINEAFAAVALWSSRMLGLSSDRVNPHGGAVALGHPLGATGARIVVTLINALQARGGGIGAATLCGGGGQGDALIVKVGR